MSQPSIDCPHCNHKGPHKVHGAGANPRFKCTSCGRTFSQLSALAEVPAQGIKGNVFVITSAVSGSLVHKPFLRALEAYCARRHAKLLVVPIRYKNPTSKYENSDDWWDSAVTEYLYSTRTELTNGLMLMADVPTQPTAARPLSGLQTFGGQNSAIFGHPKIALESIATRAGKHAKLVMTTGAITKPEYSQSKAGKKGEFHHIMGALVVEATDKAFHVRHIHANADGSFYDLETYNTEDGLEKMQKAKVLTVGDLHAVRAEPTVLDATFFGDGNMVEMLRPGVIVLHDVLDFQSASHHNTFFTTFKLHTKGKTGVADEVRDTCALIDRIAAAAPWAKVVIVDSNHDHHFMKWLQNGNNAHDPTNAKIYHETKLAVLEALERGESLNPLEFWARRLMKNIDRVQFLTTKDSLVVDGVEYSQHGDIGPNGARGAIGAFLKVGAKLVIGHSHSPGIMDGVYQVGTSSQMDMGYNKGFSSWMHTHCVQYFNGKRALVNIINGHWYFFE